MGKAIKLLSYQGKLNSSRCHTHYTRRTIMKARKIVMKTRFHGEPKKSDFQLMEEELPPVENEEFLCKAEYLSVTPYTRVRMAELPEGTTMIGLQVAKVLESKHSQYPVDSYVAGHFGWRTYTVVNPNNMPIQPYVLPDIGNLPLSLCLGILGNPGYTAYFGLLKICDPQPGEMVAVSGAAGAVGSAVGQIARIKGCKVIGFAGSNAKCEWLTKELGFDHAINYKTADVTEELKKAAPNGIDCYFDNVGGEISRKIMKQMNLNGRVSICGGISSYNEDNIPDVAISQTDIRVKQMKIEGFQSSRWTKVWMEGILQNLKWIQEGKLLYRETVTEGFENTPDAFIGMLAGENIGKAIVKI